MKYFVIENRNTGLKGCPEMKQTILFSGTKEECAKFEHEKRKEYKNRETEDCFIWSEEEMENVKRAKERWDNLTEEQKTETITVNGRTYLKALYDEKHRNK